MANVILKIDDFSGMGSDVPAFKVPVFASDFKFNVELK